MTVKNKVIVLTGVTRGFGVSAGGYPSAQEWARVAVPFLLQIDAKDNGQPLTAPG